MRTWLAALAALIAFAAAPAAAREAEPVRVMILGVYHFDNPGQDIANVEADDVLTPARQAELAALSRALRRFAPTRVAVEAVSDAPDLSLPAYAAFTPAELAANRNEVAQIGYRIARDAGLAAVQGVDERSEAIDYFPFGAVQQYAEAHGEADRIAAWIGAIRAETEAIGAAQRTHSIGQSLRAINAPAKLSADHARYYYGLNEIGDAHETPGADLNAAWYWRNARIFAKLAAICTPGDRVIVVFGAGHAYWLRHFAQTTPGFELVEPNAYLPR